MVAIVVAARCVAPIVWPMRMSMLASSTRDHALLTVVGLAQYVECFI